MTRLIAAAVLAAGLGFSAGCQKAPAPPPASKPACCCGDKCDCTADDDCGCGCKAAKAGGKCQTAK